MAFKIFYAWQSDRPNNLCRGLIRRALEDAAKELEADPDIQDAGRDGIEIDSDTQDIPGSPPVAETIFEKIRESDVFVADLTPIELIVPEDDDPEGRRQPPPNPNVLIEYGYALGALGDRRLIGVFNEAFGKPDDLPFDLRHRRWPIGYQAAVGADDDQRRQARQDLVKNLTNAIRPIIQTAAEPESGGATAEPVPEPSGTLQIWHEAAHRKFLVAADGDQDAEQLKRAHYQFSYQITTADGQQLDMARFMDELQRMSCEVMKFVRSGWQMFDILNNTDLQPRWTTDAYLGEDEFLECNLMNTDGIGLGLSDLWRVSSVGMATIIRAYEEDRDHTDTGSTAGTWFWPQGMAREIAEMIRHARVFAERFKVPETVSFRAEWYGLSGRTIRNPNIPYVGRGSELARDDHRNFSRTVPVASLSEDWHQLTADMLSPVLRMFDPNRSASAQDIQAWSKSFRR